MPHPRPLRALAPWIVVATLFSPSRAQVTQFITPDGSSFVLLPDASPYGPPVIHWVTLVPTGPDEDPAGAEGLARAIVRASLEGSGGTGSLDADRESAALDTLDAIERRGVSSRRAEQRATEAERTGAATAASALGIPDAWRRALGRAGATDIELREVDGASMVHVALPTDSLADVAILVRERRERPLLRDLRRHFAAVRTDLLTQARSPRGRMALEILGTTFPGDARARPILDEARVFTRAEALTEFAAIHSPARGLHVLTGGFDPKQVEIALRAVFNDSALPPTTEPPMPSPSASRGRRVAIQGGEFDGLSIAWPMPKTDAATALATAEWIAGGYGSRLAASLRGAGFGSIQVDFRVSFPARARPGLLLLQIVGEPRDASLLDLESAVTTILTNAAVSGPSREEIGRLEPRVRLLANRWRRTTREAAFVIAEALGLRGETVSDLFAEPVAPSSAELTRVMKALVTETERTVVNLQGRR